MSDIAPSPQTYATLLATIKDRIRSAQVRASVAVNQELVILYWTIGREILVRQQQEGWGKSIIPQLSRDLSSQFPEMKGLSPREPRLYEGFSGGLAR